MLPRPPRLVACGVPVALATGLVMVISACGGDAVESDAVKFCDQAEARTDMIIAPPMATDAELEATLEFYRLMGELAPIAIAEQWNQIVAVMETASTLVPGDANSEQQVALQAYATERSAYEVAVWLQRNCGVTIPIATIAPQDPVTARTTTTIAISVPGSTTAP